ncbi:MULTISPECIES: hypothetical protein [Enterococcus]|uniref:Rad50/SbcC-type AAA domain-containing protein n=1 Tax=Enterococcus casseliflavus TaxID=37734 RepID=A0A6N2Z6J1_ENTCA|nr:MULTISPECIES: hypothetical protein [Enterococcus]MDO0904724.1 hypothetical protein [Enterococcus sp. A1(2023)]MDO0922705.1 hypothetical protein [Enterococcus sp. A2(2023)]MDT2674792.1 hypothetical protein [Enterococcus dongliensis]
MYFRSLELSYGNSVKTFLFSENVNLVVSKENSVGKSTLLRLLFYSMGYSIPGTKGIKFKNVKTKLTIETNKGLIILERDDKFIDFKQNGNTHLFFLPNDSESLHSFIFETDNEKVLSNILGAIYLDQEKGWTLLNRGIVIGKQYFNLKDLISGLAERESRTLELELESVVSEQKKYKTMKNLYDYKTTLLDIKDSDFSSDYIDELERDLNILLMDKNILKKQIKDIEVSYKDNISFVEYIENMRLYIENNGEKIQVTKENLVDFEDNQELLNTRKKILEFKKRKLEAKIIEVQDKIAKESSLISLQSEIQKFDSQVANLIINPISLDKIIKQLKQREKELKKMIFDKITINNSIIDNVYLSIQRYAKELDIYQYMDDNRDYIFTDDLKGFSGAVYHKMVFSFKMAYIIELQKYLGYKLPIVLDSPSGREVDQKNISDIMKILSRDFKDNQIIIASIYDDYGFEKTNRIELDKGIFI